MTRLRVLPVLVVLLLLASCGDDNGGIIPTTAGSVTTVGGSSTTGRDTTTSAAVSGAVDSLEGVRGAVVQIVGEGSFIDPGTGTQATVAGAGSGFIIDPSGLAVTNNHVVTGAALLKVYVDGMEGPQNAHVVAVSECSDLAVIDINGDGFPFLEWYDGAVTTGLSIFVAGYPLGDAEYTLLDGIVSKESVDGETYWSSVDSVIEHSADTLPGNSGGPLVTADGKVVGINYAGNDVGQSFAIGIDVARPFVDQLVTGVDLETIGVNGEALFVDGFDGIWVYSVASGSPADNAGVKGGDLITSLENFPVGLDGTMADYCDILRSHTADDVLEIEVYRQATQEVLEGQLNGRLLEVVTSFAVDLGGDVPDDVGVANYSDYMLISDDSGVIQVNVPTEWFDIDGTAWTRGGVEIGPQVGAASDLAAWRAEWGTPGVFVGASATFGQAPAELLDNDYQFSGSCDYSGRFDYSDPAYTGVYDLWENCGPEGSTFVVLAAEPGDGSFLILVQVVVVTDRDLAALDEVLRTFYVIGSLD